MGSFEAQFPYCPPHVNDQDIELERLFSSAHPGLDTLDTMKNPWGMMFHPPQEESWSPTSPYVPKKTHEDNVLVLILRAVQSKHKGINYVFIKAIPLFADGLTGIGHSTEVRAFMFCYISSIYSPLPNTTIFRQSPRSQTLTRRLRPLANSIFRQLLPVMTGLSHVPLDSVRPRWHNVPVLPMWYFLLDDFPLADGQFRNNDLPKTVDKIISLMTDLQAFRNSLPALPSDPDVPQEVHPIPLPVIIALCIFAKLPQGDVKRHGRVFLKGQRVSQRSSWLFFTSLNGVGAYETSLAGLGLSGLWAGAKPRLQLPLISLIPKLEPGHYKERVEVVTHTLLELWP